MTTARQLLLPLGLLLIAGMTTTVAQNNIAEEVVWVVGDEPIFKSEVEEQYLNLQYERVELDGNPYCVIPEQMAIDKLFLHQAKLDTVEVQDTQIAKEVDSRINYYIANLGSKEKVEEYFHQPMPQMRERLMDMFRDQYAIQMVQRGLTEKVKATPSDVRRFFNTIPKDSLPYIPLQVVVQIITINPTIPQQEIDEVKARLRDYAARVTSGESEFSTLAILYSEDQATSVYGGETGFQGRAVLLPEYATAAFNLNDTKRVSNIVEAEDGYHIIQLIEKRGDRINTRHILLRPKVSETDLVDAVNRLDSVRNDIVAGKVDFKDAAFYLSQDKDSRNNSGIMLNEQTHSNRFEMQDLPAEVGRLIDTMQPGEVSKPFVMTNSKTRREQVCIVRLMERIDGHKADIGEDYQAIKEMCENRKKQQIVTDWIKEKQRTTYVFIDPAWRNCEFKYNWLNKDDSK